MYVNIIRTTLGLTVTVIAAIALYASIRALMASLSGMRRPRGAASSDYIELQTAARAADTPSVSTDIRKVQGFPVILNMEMQNRFIPGRDAYEFARNSGNVRSVIFRDAAGLQKLLDEKAGTGDLITTSKEKVNFNQPLGQYVDPEAKTKVSTTVGVIHYTQEGAYIVPARPLAGEEYNG